MSITKEQVVLIKAFIFVCILIGFTHVTEGLLAQSEEVIGESAQTDPIPQEGSSASEPDEDESTDQLEVSDVDGDGVPDDEDNCPRLPNLEQPDMDGDGVGDVCDIDMDGDGVHNTIDNCPDDYNPSPQSDLDHDGIGDICDICVNDFYNDIDNDLICGDADNCQQVYNILQSDLDRDGRGDLCDPCPMDYNDDIDGDGYCADVDNCPDRHNLEQLDSDGDGIGDACDPCDPVRCTSE